MDVWMYGWMEFCNVKSKLIGRIIILREVFLGCDNLIRIIIIIIFVAIINFK